AKLILSQPNVQAHDPFIVAKEDGKLFANDVLERRSQLEMDSLHDQFRRDVVGMIRHGRHLDRRFVIEWLRTGGWVPNLTAVARRINLSTDAKGGSPFLR